MKKLFIKLLLVSLSCNFCARQEINQQTNDPNQNKAATAKIDKKVILIDQSYKSTTISKDLFFQPNYEKHIEPEASHIYRLGSSVLEASYSKDELVKIEVMLEGDRETLISQYYFDGGHLIFVRKIFQVFDPPKWEAGSKAVSRKVNRYYFDRKQLITWLNEKNEIVSPHAPEFVKKEKQILETLRYYSIYLEGK